MRITERRSSIIFPAGSRIGGQHQHDGIDEAFAVFEPYSPGMSSSARPPDSFPSTPAVEHAPEARSWSERFKRWIGSSPRLHAVVIAVLALALVAGAVAHLIELRGVREAAADERSALVQSATKELTDQRSSLLRLSALPLAWAIRGALLKDDFATADAYVQRMVQEKHVTGVALVTADGKVRLAGSRKLEGHPAEEAFPGVALNDAEPVVVTSDNALRAVVPIMGIDRRLGTLIFSYAAPSAEGWGTTSGHR